MLSNMSPHGLLAALQRKNTSAVTLVQENMLEAGSGKRPRIVIADAPQRSELWCSHSRCDGGPQAALILGQGTEGVGTERLCIRVLTTAELWRGAEKFCTACRPTTTYRMM